MANEYYLAEQGADRLLNEDGSLLLLEQSFQTTFLEPGGDATFDLATTNGFWKTINGTPTIASDFVHGTHSRAIGLTGGAYNALTTPNGTASDSGGRLSFYAYFVARPADSREVINIVDASAGSRFAIRFNADGTIGLNGTAGTNMGLGTTVLALNTWYRISLAWTVTSATVNRFELKINAATELSVTNFSSVGTGAAGVTFASTIPATMDWRLSDIYLDNSSSLTDTGDIWVTAKRPNANGTTNGFTTQIGTGGSGYGTGHSPQVNERALSIANGWSMVGAGAAITEQYNIESLATGDISLTGATIIDYLGWISAKALVAAGANILVNGTSTAISLTTAEKMFTKIANSSTYPAGTGADVGITTDTTLTTVSLYEAGVVVAYIPGAPVGGVNNQRLMLMGVG